MTPSNTKIHLARPLGNLWDRTNILRAGDPERYPDENDSINLTVTFGSGGCHWVT
jgi:hypothetical protein